MMVIPVNSLTPKQFEEYLMRVVECAFREGMLWQKCGGENLVPLSDAIKSAQMSIVVDGYV